MNPTRILLLEDDASLCVSLTQLLQLSGYQVSSFSVGAALLAHVQSVALVDAGRTLILMDMHLRGESGIDVQKALRELGIGWPVIFMSAHEDARKVNQAWQDGALNFLFKPFTPDELLEAIERVMLPASAALPTAAAGIDPQMLEKFGRLTPRQKEVLQRVACGQSNTTIATEMAISARTVKMHRESMMHRLGFTHVTELVRFHDACQALL